MRPVAHPRTLAHFHKAPPRPSPCFLATSAVVRHSQKGRPSRFSQPVMLFFSRSRSPPLPSRPHAYPDRVPSFLTTRCHGIATAILLAAQALATARTAFGAPILCARSAYVAVFPTGIFRQDTPTFC